MCYAITSDVMFGQGWAQEPMRDATLEYRLSIYHARASDTGLYTCNTPNNKSHSIHILVADVRLLMHRISFAEFIMILGLVTAKEC